MSGLSTVVLGAITVESNSVHLPYEGSASIGKALTALKIGAP